MSVFGNGRSGSAPTGKSNPLVPKRKSIYNDAHEAADTDQDRSAIHHTLGKGPNQAASGDHNHKDVLLPRQQAFLCVPEPLPANAEYRMINWDFVESGSRPNWGWDGNGGFIIPEDGWYRVDVRLLYPPLASSGYKTHLYIYCNNALQGVTDKVIFQGNYEAIDCWAEFNANKGQTVDIRSYCTTSGISVYGTGIGGITERRSYVSIRKISEKWV